MIPELKPIKEKVRKFRGELLAEIELPMHYAGVHWIVVQVYGKIVPAEFESLPGRGTVEQYARSIQDMTCYQGDECLDAFLPESLLEVISNEILAGDHD